MARSSMGAPPARRGGRAIPISEHVGAYYLRLMVVDQPGVLADVTAVLRDHGISLESMLQHGRAPGEAVPIVLVTHETKEAAVARRSTASPAWRRCWRRRR